MARLSPGRKDAAPRDSEAVRRNSGKKAALRRNYYKYRIIPLAPN